MARNIPRASRRIDSDPLPADHDIRFPGETDEHRRRRDDLLAAEVDLRRSIERVAAQRRALPLGDPVPEDYIFEEAADGHREVRFSELFQPGMGVNAEYPLFPTSREKRLPRDEHSWLTGAPSA